MEEEHDEECPNCDMIVEVKEWEDGECAHCGTCYLWEEYLDDDGNIEVIIVWNR